MNDLKSIIRAVPALSIAEPECGWEAHDARVAAETAATVGLEHAAKLEAMQVPRILHSDILTGLNPSQAVKAMQAFWVAPQSLSVLSGATGTGKTVAAATWLLHAPVDIARRRDVRPRRFVAAADFCAISSYDRELFELVTKAAYLVLDDLGQEYGDKREYGAQRIDDLIARRHGDMLPTVITTNLSVQEVRSRYGARVSSRLNDALVTTIRGAADLRGAR